MTWSIEDAARAMGMASHEVLAVAEVGDYHVVTTHDGQHTAVTEEGEVLLLTKEQAAGLGIGEQAETDESVEDPDVAEIAELARQEQENQGQPPAPVVPVPDPGDEQPDAVPDVSKDELLAWVGEDTERAARALAVEQERDKPRSTVVAELEKVAQA